MNRLNIEYLNQKLADRELIKKTKLIKTDKYTMGAITTRGTNTKRQYNQDYSAIMTYPENDDLAMIIMADGKDDSINGIAASRELVHVLSNWFLSKQMSESYINMPVVLEGRLLGELRELNRRIYEDSAVGDTSFALAIIGNQYTLIANVGNVRCYSLNENEINLQTTDNLAWYLYNDPNLITPDEVKYLSGKDFISRTIGKNDNSKRHFEPFISIIKNSEYDSLLLTTHGVNDILDSDELFNFIKENDVSDALYKIAYSSVFSSPKKYPKYLLDRFKNKENMIIERTIPGDSNASALVYKKTKNS